MYEIFCQLRQLILAQLEDCELLQLDKLLQLDVFSQYIVNCFLLAESVLITKKAVCFYVLLVACIAKSAFPLVLLAVVSNLACLCRSYMYNLNARDWRHKSIR